MNNLIERFQQHKYFQRIFNIQDDIIMIFLSGSRISGIIDEYSDYDIGVFCPNYQLQDCYQRVQAASGEVIHWYYNNLETLSGKHFVKEDKNFGLMLVYFLEKSFVLYTNPKYDNWISTLFENRETIAKHQALLFYKYSLPTIYDLINHKTILPQKYKKNIYQLCLAYNILLNKPIDSDFLIRIKRISHQAPDSNDISKAYEIIMQLHNYCQSLDYNYEQESQKLYNMLLQALPGDK